MIVTSNSKYIRLSEDRYFDILLPSEVVLEDDSSLCPDVLSCNVVDVTVGGVSFVVSFEVVIDVLQPSQE